MPSLHRHTPTLSVLDARGLQVRSVAWCRSAPDAPAEARVHRARFDAAGHEVAQWDPRLWARKQYDPATPANLQNLYTLSGAVLSTASVDAGWRISLLGDAGHLMQSWDGRGSEQRNHYDELLRPTALFAKALNSDTLTCISRYSYGSVDADSALNNQCGRLIRHDDLAGTRHFPAFGLLGGVLEQQQCFLKALGPVNWPENIPERNDLLEPQGYSSRSTFNAVGETSEQADAQRNVQRFTQTIDGQLHELRLLQANMPTAKVLVSQIQHNAHGQITAQTAGNGVVSAFEYCPRDGRLMRLHAGALQDLNFIYDPVGNIVSLEDKAQVARHFAGQRIDPINRYTYDSLYQLIHATGWESGSANQGPAHLPDPQAVANYQQTYRYDAGGNLLELTHLGPQNHSRLLVADECSNRCLPVKGSRRTVADGFDENGNLLALDNGRSLTWDLHNQLTHVRPVQREGAEDDSEHYVYGAEGMRLRKIRISQTNARTVISETRYLPGLELRTNATGETVQVITAQAGRNAVQVLHWASRPPKGVANDLCRYTLADHLGSCSVELDSDAQIISRETYHSFGTTAFSDTGNASQTSYRTLRYSGKELDATGLYYYGRRYYMPWLQRWVNTDPTGDTDGANLYAFVSGNPLTFIDHEGEGRIDINHLSDEQRKAIDLDGEQVPSADMLSDLVSGQVKPSNPVYKVDAGTFTSLEQAHVANLMTKLLLVNGSQNQKVDLWRSKISPKKMIKKIHQARDTQKPLGDIAKVIEHGVGNCGEHAMINFHLLASTQTLEPVFWVTQAGANDHSFVVIGDPGQLPLHKLVIVDAWPTFPVAHTADVGTFSIGSVLASAPREAVVEYAVTDAILKKNSEMRFPVFRDRLAALKRMNKIEQQKKVFVQLYSVKDAFRGVSYMHQESRRLSSQLPRSYVNDRMNHFVSYRAMRGN